MNLTIRTSACTLFALGVTVSSFGITFNNTFDGTVTGLSNAAMFESDVAYAENIISSHFVDPISINITIKYSSSTGVLGESSTPVWTGLTYAQVRGALIADAKSAADAAAIASLPVLDPTGGGSFMMSTAEAKALPTLGLANPGNDGTFTFGNQSYALDPNNRAVANAYDFIGVATHEITEIMGRIPGIGSGIADASAFDLFRYTAPGTRSFTPYAPAYFSINGGVTNLKGFNQVVGADTQDWDSADPDDSFNAFGDPGHIGLVTAPDFTAMDVIGYDPAATPEPSTFAALAGGFGLLLLRRRRRS